MSRHYKKSSSSASTFMVFHQVKNKPTFTYFSPLKIYDQNFPQDISPQLNSVFITPNFGGHQNELDPQVRGQQNFYDITNMSHGVKFNKAAFVKMKNINYTKNYKIIMNCIGKGAYGTVRKVKSLITNEERAAKCIQKNVLKKDELRKLLIEVYIMRELDHPNIANLLEVYDYKNEFILICEICGGGDLLQFLKSANRKKKHQKFVGLIIKQLLRTVIYLHNKGIVHRDIKPQNILFEKTDSHNIKLIDFGIATKIQPGELLRTRIGTPAYMAPQIITQKYTEKVDVWAIGITMYHLISGRIPFRGNTVKQIMHQIAKNEIDFSDDVWKTISPECINVIKLMTIKNYEDRPSAKDVFYNPYFQKVGDEDLPEDEKQQFAQNIRNFEFKNKLQAAIQTFIASQLLSMEQKNELVNFFREFDKDNDGVISIIQLKAALEQRKKISAERINSLMDIIDTNGSGQIDYTQFLAAGFLDAKSFTTERLKQAFAHFDTNGNGRISLEEVMVFMSELGDSEKQIRQIFTEFDKNGDGSISEGEFISLMLERSKNLNLNEIKEKKREKECEKRLDLNNLNN